MCNALLHFGWVAVLTVCQTYQVVCLGMTTNERMNRGRYRHFQAHGGRSPFTRGPLRNAAEFCECGCCGLVPVARVDWQQAFEVEGGKMGAGVVEREPLLRGGGGADGDVESGDNYQYV